MREDSPGKRKGKAWSEAMYRTSGGFEAPLLPCGGSVSPAAGKHWRLRRQLGLKPAKPGR